MRVGRLPNGWKDIAARESRRPNPIARSLKEIAVAVMIGLFVILALVLVLPFSVKLVEENLEAFLFVMGGLAVTITSQWTWPLLEEALVEPIKITIAVLVAGIVFRLARGAVDRFVALTASAMGVRLFAFAVVVVLGLVSSAITAIIAALVLVEIVGHLGLDRKASVTLVVIACFSIGIGAALTPIGEPLATIAIGKLRGEPYHAGFWFLFRHIWYYVVPGILALGALAAFLIGKNEKGDAGFARSEEEGTKDIALRTVKVYVFVMALTFLGAGFKPIIDAFIVKIPMAGLYWINSISAVLDNATLAAAEISPSMSLVQIVSAILGLIIAGGMLIPGNIPNIISAGKLKIRSEEWAKIGIPIGLAMMAVYFVALLLIG